MFSMFTTTAKKTSPSEAAVATGGAGPKGRRRVIANQTDEGLLDAANRTIYNKAPEIKNALRAALSKHYLFSAIGETNTAFMIDAMKPLTCAAGKNVITQGEPGSEFFVLLSGTAEAIVDGKAVTRYREGGAFGELALMYSAPRAATVAATSSCKLCALDMKNFRLILAGTSSSTMWARCDFLRKVPLLEPLTDNQITRVAECLTEESFQQGKYIIREGEAGDCFYLIQHGQVKCTASKAALTPRDKPSEIDLLDLGPGDYFGEMALMLEEPRHANVKALTKEVHCLKLGRTDFVNMLGPLQDVLASQMRIRILRSVPLLAQLTDYELDKIANAMRVQAFKPGQYIIRQGSEGTRFYIINEGVVTCTREEKDGKQTELIKLSNQEYFGERALLREEPRKVNVKADGHVECLVLERQTFQKHLGTLSTTFQEEMKRREKNSKTVGGAAGPGGAGGDVNHTLTQLPFRELQLMHILGTGTFGKVKLVRHKDKKSGQKKLYALKAMCKAQIVQSHQERNIMNEKNLLVECRHPLIIELVSTYNTTHQIFLLMEFVQGGELWTYIYEKPKLIGRNKQLGGFHTKPAQFYASCVVLAFEAIHGRGVAYRDLKPENLLLDDRGYLKVIDFGFAKRIPFSKGSKLMSKSYTLCGTPEYLAPELVLSKGHDRAIDYWALGCLVFELLVGRTPFAHDSQNEIFKRIIHSKKTLAFPKNMDKPAVDLINKLLSPNPSYRLGNQHGGVGEIKSHPWFGEALMDSILEGKEAAPYVPELTDASDTSCFDAVEDDGFVPPYSGSQKVFTAF